MIEFDNYKIFLLQAAQANDFPQIVKLLKSNPDPSTKTPENTTVPS